MLLRKIGDMNVSDALNGCKVMNAS